MFDWLNKLSVPIQKATAGFFKEAAHGAYRSEAEVTGTARSNIPLIKKIKAQLGATSITARLHGEKMGGRVLWRGATPEVVIGKNAPLSVVAHEFSHATGWHIPNWSPKKYIGKSLALGLGVAALAPNEDVRQNAWLIPALAAAPRILEESRASFRAIRALRALNLPIGRASKSLGLALSTYIVPALATTATVAAVGQLRSSMPTENGAYYAFDGLAHGGSAEQIRHEMTPFGSKYDRVRALAKMMGETFESLSKSSKFQQALTSGEVVERIGAGSFGEVHLMKAKFGGETFEYVRKTASAQRAEAFFAQRGISGSEREGWMRALDVSHEARMMSPFGELETIPSVYGVNKEAGVLYMEAMPGATIAELQEAGFNVPQRALEALHRDVKKVAGLGVRNLDIHAGNIMYDPLTQRASWLDFGLGKTFQPLNQEFFAHKMAGEMTSTLSPVMGRAAGQSPVQAIKSSITTGKLKKSLSTAGRHKPLGAVPRNYLSSTTPVNDPMMVVSNKSQTTDYSTAIYGMSHSGMSARKRTSLTDFGSPWRGWFRSVSRSITKRLAKKAIPGAAKLLDPRKAAKMAHNKSVAEFADSLGGVVIKGESKMTAAQKPWVEAFAERNIGAGYYPRPKDPMLAQEMPEGLIYVDPQRVRQIARQHLADIKMGASDRAMAERVIESEDYLKKVIYHEHLERQVTQRYGEVGLMESKRLGIRHQAGQVILGEAGFIRATGNKELERVYSMLRKTRIEHKTFQAGLEAFGETGSAPELRKLITDFGSGYCGLHTSTSRVVAQTNSYSRAANKLTQSSRGLRLAQEQLWERARSGGRGHLKRAGQPVNGGM